jgi:hypothetical protein
MGNSYAISALSDKRAEIVGKILDLERQLRVHRSELMHLDAAMTLLDPSIKPHSIRAKQPMADRSGHFAMGEISRRCYDGLRTGGEKGASPDEIALKAMADTGRLPAFRHRTRQTRSGTARECGGGSERRLGQQHSPQ